MYFRLLEELPPLVIVAYRITWALVFLLLVTAIGRRWSNVRRVLTVRRVGWLAAAAVLLATNWLTYVFAVTSGHVVDASLGYFINPLVSVVLAVLVLHERLTATQWTSVALAAVGVVVITASSGLVPWVGLVLAVSFGTYGLIRKRLDIGTVEGLTVETAVLLPAALVILLVSGSGLTGSGTTTGSLPVPLLVVLLGPITALPLLAFGAATQRLPLTIVGMLQYICPTIILVLGLTVFDEPMTTGEWIGFGLIWGALALLTWTMVRRAGRPGPAVAPTEAA